MDREQRRAALIAGWRVVSEAGRYPSQLPSPPIARVWAPTMTEQQKKEHEQYVIDQKLPF